MSNKKIRKKIHGLFKKIKLEDSNKSSLEYLNFSLQIKISMSQEEDS